MTRFESKVLTLFYLYTHLHGTCTCCENIVYTLLFNSTMHFIFHIHTSTNNYFDSVLKFCLSSSLVCLYIEWLIIMLPLSPCIKLKSRNASHGHLFTSYILLSSHDQCNQLRWVKSKVSFSDIHKWTSCVHQIQITSCLKNYTRYCLVQPNSMIENRICLLYHALVISCQMINLFLQATVISSHLFTLWKY